MECYLWLLYKLSLWVITGDTYMVAMYVFITVCISGGLLQDLCIQNICKLLDWVEQWKLQSELSWWEEWMKDYDSTDSGEWSWWKPWKDFTN